VQIGESPEDFWRGPPNSASSFSERTCSARSFASLAPWRDLSRRSRPTFRHRPWRVALTRRLRRWALDVRRWALGVCGSAALNLSSLRTSPPAFQPQSARLPPSFSQRFVLPFHHGVPHPHSAFFSSGSPAPSAACEPNLRPTMLRQLQNPLSILFNPFNPQILSCIGEHPKKGGKRLHLPLETRLKDPADLPLKWVHTVRSFFVPFVDQKTPRAPAESRPSRSFIFRDFRVFRGSQTTAT
jgi:hypothetical protein